MVQRASFTEVLGLMECTKMDRKDRLEYDDVFGVPPFEVCSRWWQHVTRPRWWWFSRPVHFGAAGLEKSAFNKEVMIVQPAVDKTHWSSVLQPGWTLWEEKTQCSLA